MPTAVVVSTWTGNPEIWLSELLDSLAGHDAGAEFELFLCANGLEYRVPERIAGRFRAVFVRENTGFNLGAWDHAWRRLAGYDQFLFLQDDCLARRGGWLGDFVRRFDAVPRCGLVGEQINRAWDRPWSELTDIDEQTSRDGKPKPDLVRRACVYRERLAGWGIPPGATARHVTTVVQFTRREVLERVGGYEIGATKQDAIAAEIAFSRKIEAAGLVLVQLGRRRHSRIGHREWASDGFLGRMRNSLGKRLRRPPPSQDGTRVSG